MMSTQRSGDRPETPLETETEPLASYAWLLDPATLQEPRGYRYAPWRERSYFDEDLAAFKRDIRIHGNPKPVEQPTARDDDIGKGLPDCKRRTTAIGLLVGAGFVAGLLAAAVFGWLL